jgi:pSer/pThr/pTyr-binding forkhead associated (FHA) protein
MQRYFTIVEGEGQGQIKPFTSALMIVGRAQEAEIHLDDPSNKVSKLHLQVRVEADVVFVENKSQFGTMLNGKMLNGTVSLEAGDILKVGDIKLRYEESAVGPPPSPSASRDAESYSEAPMDATKVADPVILAALERERRKGQEDEVDATRVAVDEGTRMMDARELGRIKAPPKDTKSSSSSPLIGIVLVFIAAVMAGTFWFLRQRAAAESAAMIPVNDLSYSFGFSYPANWVKTQDTDDAIGFGFGQDGEADMARVLVFHDKAADNALTGLTDGFLRYHDVFTKQFNGFELTFSRRQLSGNGDATKGDATIIFFAFQAHGKKGKGIFLLNAETRLVMVCYSPIGAYERYRTELDSILQSFHLNSDEPQQFIDYAMPDASMTMLASADPVELTRQFNDHIAKGADLLENRLLKPGYLSLAMKEYRTAVQLSLAGPERLSSWRPAAEGLVEATKLFNQAMDEQRKKIILDQKQGNTQRALWEAQKMLQMVPDKSDPAYTNAYVTFRSLRRGRP